MTLNSVLDSSLNKTITKKICPKGPKLWSAKGMATLHCSRLELSNNISYWILLSPIWQNIKSILQYWARPKVEPNIEVET
jgi:hypothetical protein